MTCVEILCDSSNFKAGRSAKISYIVMHYTANKGDTARSNGKYFAGNPDLKASAHYFVDENEVVRSVQEEDTAWHCGGALQGSGGHSVYGKCRNANSIGVEMCSDYADGAYLITDKTVDRAAELVRDLMDRYSIPVEHVVRHYDVTGKNCPAPWVSDESLWTAFQVRMSNQEAETKEDEVTRYQKLSDIPNIYGFQTVVEKLMNAGIINGDGSDPKGNDDVIDLSHDQVRTLVFEYYGGAFDRKLIAMGMQPAVED